MNWKIFFSLIFFIVVVSLLVFYWFIPMKKIEFTSEIKNYNFSLTKTDMQFYKNMRFPDSKISYKIADCPLQKQDNMENAFEIMENKTILDFYSVISDEDITITCDSKNKIEGGMFIAGEGGPTKVIQSGEFNVIFKGKVLLIKESQCERPNIALHELLHVLGFNHSENPNNIMYPVLDCDQTIGEDIPKLINELYSIEKYPDLAFENASAFMNGKYLNANISIRNEGLSSSKKANVIIYADETIVKEVELVPLEIGYGSQLAMQNIWIPKLNINQLKIVIDYPEEELKKVNNEMFLEISSF